MVYVELVANSVQKLREAGLSENVIQSTLADLGLTPQQVQGFLGQSQKASAASPSPALMSSTNFSFPASVLSSNDHEAIASLTQEKIQQGLAQNQSMRLDENALKDNITHLALEQHGQQLMDTHQAVMELHDKIDSTNVQALVSKVNTLSVRMDSMAKDTQELRALASALQGLMQKILETNQQLVFEIKKK